MKKVFYISTFNSTFFLNFEQGTLHFHVVPDLTDNVVWTDFQGDWVLKGAPVIKPHFSSLEHSSLEHLHAFHLSCFFEFIPYYCT